MAEYPYILKNQQALQTVYPFVDYEGAAFIHEYKAIRGKIINGLKDKYYRDPDPELLKNCQELLKKLNSGGEVSTNSIIETLIFCYDKISNNNEMYKKIMKKAELKKLKTRLKTSELKSVGEEAGIKEYVRFSYLTQKNIYSHQIEKYLQPLSTLLKINDFVISGIEGLDDNELYLLKRSLIKEFECISELTKKLKQIELKERMKPEVIENENQKIIKNLGMIVQDKPRARAYIQSLVKAGLVPNFVIILEESGQVKKKDALDKAVEGIDFFNSEESVIETCKKNNIKIEIINAKEFNDPQAVDALRKRTEEYYVFSGSGILKKEILTAKKLIHVHPGWLPDFRGSTTFLFSLLATHECAATSFIMNEGIDTGDIITMRKFLPPDENTDISRIYDPYIRSIVLVDTIKKLDQKKILQGYRQDPGMGENYFTIHPVLRTIAVGFYKDDLKNFDI